jgi:hypothetical protein
MSKQDKKLMILIIIVWIIYFGGIFIATRNKKVIDKDYIQNLEEKLNIYEEDYDRFCLEDSLRQTY